MKRKPIKDPNGFGEWGGYMEAKMSKLEEQYSTDAEKGNIYKKSDLFEGISIFVNGYTKPSADELKRIMMTHNGIYHHYQRSSTKFIIATNLPDVKIRAITNDKIVSPQWIVDSVKENKVLDYTKYLLYTNQRVSQPKIKFNRQTDSKKTISSTTVKEEAPIIQNDSENDMVNIMKEVNILNQKMIGKFKRGEIIDLVSNSSDDSEKKNLTDFAGDTAIELQSNGSISEDFMEPLCITESSSDESECEKNQDERKPSMIIRAPDNQPTVVSHRTAVDPKFLSEFFDKSRLHHISSLGAGFKQHITEIRENHNGLFPGHERLRAAFNIEQSCSKSNMETIGKSSSSKDGIVVMHIDMDCFFVSVGLRNRPHLRGYPVAVTHSKGSEAGKIQPREGVDRQAEIDIYSKRLRKQFQDLEFEKATNDSEDVGKSEKNFFTTVDANQSMSEIASCSYEARRMGVKNGMFVGAALKLCPNLKTIPYDFEGYKEVGFTLYNTIAEYTVDIEAVSCDEMFVDLSTLFQLFPISVEDFVTFLRDEIKTKTGCPCSAGLGANRLQARLATKKAKPDGQFYLRSADVVEFMENIPVSELPGVGFTTTKRLNHFGWVDCKHLQLRSLSELQKDFGKKFGETLYQFCRGIDNRPFVFDQVRKSVSVDVNYGIRFQKQEEVETFMRQLATEVHKRLTDIKRRGKCVTLKLMVRAKDAPVETSKFMGHGICDYMNKSISFPDYTADLNVIENSVISILKGLAVPPKELRGIGIQITKLDQTSTSEMLNKKENTLVKMFENAKPKSSKTKPKHETETNAPVPNAPVPLSTRETTKIVRRGRPRKTVQKSNLESFLKNSPSMSNSDETVPDGLDPEFLKELPEDIRNEVICDHRRNITKPQLKEKTETIEQEFLDALPPDLREELKIELKNKKSATTLKIQNPLSDSDVSPRTQPEVNSSISDDNIFMGDWLNLLKAWVNTDKPFEKDVDILGEHASQLVVSKEHWSDLYIRMKYLHRIIDEKHSDCDWHQAYFNIVKIVQLEMIATTGSRMKIKCEFLNCKNELCK